MMYIRLSLSLLYFLLPFLCLSQGQKAQTPQFNTFQTINTSPALSNQFPVNNSNTSHQISNTNYSAETIESETEKNKRIFQNMPCKPNIKDAHYEQAYKEINAMLSGESKKSFKRAVFLTENAFKGGTLDYNEYCAEIDRIVVKLKEMVAKKGISHYKTAFNWAIFTYMSEKIPENNFQSYDYDYINFMGDKDYESLLVTSLLKTKLGNCHSLPYLYKILADEVGAEAFISLAPMHCFIRHKDEEGKLWNLEMTSGSFSRTSFIIEQFNISTKAIETGLYMKPLDVNETLANCLLDMLTYYDEQYHIYSDDFVKKVYELGLKYYPSSLLQLSKADDMKFRIDCKMGEKGVFDYSEMKKHPDLVALSQEYEAIKKYIEEMGYEKFPEEKYRQMVKGIEEEKKKQLSKK